MLPLRHIICLFFFLYASYGMGQLTTPELRCVAVANNGDVTITWLASTDPGGVFDSYRIYFSSNAGGPFAEIGNVNNLATTTYTHVGAGGNTQVAYYYVVARDNAMNETNPQDTLGSMLLTVSNLGDGTATLDWNAMANPNLPTWTGQYNVFREYPAGTWTQIATTTNRTYKDTITICMVTYNYRIEMDDASGCTSVSSRDGGAFRDIIVPNTPVLDTASVDPNNLASLGWSASSSQDVVGYVIYQQGGGFWNAVDTVWGRNNTQYSNPASAAGQLSEQYRIAAFDSCGNTSPLGMAHQTIFLSSVPDVCAKENLLKWNAYVNLSPALAGYDVYQSENGGAFQLVASLNGTASSYLHTGLNDNSTYCYFVQAFDANKTKTVSSNRFCYQVQPPNKPAFVYNRFATVVNDDRVDISCHVDNSVTVQEYKILRATNPGGPFVEVGFITPSGGQVETYSDYNVLPDEESYYYKVMALDSCGYDDLVSNVNRTMLLTAEGNGDLTNTLTWNDYELFQGNILEYEIYRAIDGNFDMNPIATVPYTAAGTNIYVDDVAAIMIGDGVFSYFIKAKEDVGNTYNYTDDAHSNVAEALQDFKLFIPNAFAPKGVNTIFIPVSVYIDKQEYEFRIYNRWGQKLFETDDPGMGWDGTFKGELVQPGAYVYFIRIKTSIGEYIERKGTVALIR